jgi:4-amino-4-deoxy-L-arabinose transferase-like glycosyltransferase
MACPPVFRAPALLLLLVPAVLLYPCLGFRLFEPDESRYAEIPREMLQRGELVVPLLQGQPYLDKPPLLYWLVMLSYRLFGAHDWAARLVPALAVHGCVLLVYLFGRRWLGERAAWWGALALALAPGFLGMGRLLLLDGLLTFWVTLALFSAYAATRGPALHRGWWALSAVACGLGALTKGPVALLLLAPPLWLYPRLSGQGVRPGRRALLGFAALVALVALPWYIALTAREPSFASYFLWEHNVRRFLAPAMHVRGVWFYAPVVLGGLLPGALLLVPFLRFLLSGDEENSRLRSPELGFLILAGGWCVLFFTLSACKLPTYVLPALPPFALALGHFVAHSRWRASRWTAGAAGATFVLLLAFHYAALPWYAAYRSPMSRPGEVLALCAEREAPLVCYPRNCDSISFYLGRDDLRTYRSKDIDDLRVLVRSQPRTVILCTHRHSLQGLKQLLPPDVFVVREMRMGLQNIPGVPRWAMRPLARLMGETALGLSDLAVVQPWWALQPPNLAASAATTEREARPGPTPAPPE